MSILLRLKRGLKAKLPTLQEAELGYTTDEKKLYLGTSGGNVELARADQTVKKTGDAMTGPYYLKSRGASGDDRNTFVFDDPVNQQQLRFVDSGPDKRSVELIKIEPGGESSTVFSFFDRTKIKNIWRYMQDDSLYVEVPLHIFQNMTLQSQIFAINSDNTPRIRFQNGAGAIAADIVTRIDYGDVFARDLFFRIHRGANNDTFSLRAMTHVTTREYLIWHSGILQRGLMTLSVPSGAGTLEGPTFGTPFTKEPIVFISKNMVAGDIVDIWATSITATTCSLRYINKTSAAITVYAGWMACEPW